MLLGRDAILQTGFLPSLNSRSRGRLDYARKVFDEMIERSVEVYAALIGSYCPCEKWVEVFSVFGLIVFDGVLLVVKLERIWRMIHGFVVRRDMGSDVFVSNALIDVYANCGNLKCAISVFDVMQDRDVVSWTALVSAYMDEGLVNEVEETFKLMELSGVKPDLISWNALVSSYARNGEVHWSIILFDFSGHLCWSSKNRGWSSKLYFDSVLVRSLM